MNNAYLINKRAPEAMLYNDQSVLENMHLTKVCLRGVSVSGILVEANTGGGSPARNLKGGDTLLMRSSSLGQTPVWGGHLHGT